LGYIFVADSIDPSSITLMQSAPKANAITPFTVIQGHDFGTIRKLICNFLLMINTNLHPILHHFWVIADYCTGQMFTFYTRSGWTPKLRTTKFGPKKLETSLYNMVLDIFTDDYFVLSQSMCLTDGQMDGRTDRH